MNRTTLIFLLGMCMFMGCRDSVRDEDDTTLASADNALADHLYNDIFKQVHYTIMRDTVLNNRDTIIGVDACFDTIFRTPNFGPYPITLTMDYGTNGIVCADGRARSGKIHATLSAPYRTSGSVVEIELEDYRMEAYRVYANYLLRFDTAAQFFPDVTKTITDGQVLTDDPGYIGKNILFDTEQVMQLTSGMSTDTTSDDRWSYTGTYTGRNTRGSYYTATIDRPVRVGMDCLWETHGSYTIKFDRISERLVTYKEASCGNIIEVTINNGTYNVSLPQ